MPRAIPALPGAVLAGLLVGAEFEFEGGADDAAHGIVLTFPAPVLLFDGAEGGGRPGKGFAELDTLDAVPHERVCETDERDEAAVEDLSFRTRLDFAALDCVDKEEVCAQFRGMDPVATLGPGSDG